MQWTLILCLTNALCIAQGAWAQYGVPMPVYAVPPPVMPMLVPALVVHPHPSVRTTTTTTTTTPRSVAVAVPVAVPVGVPYAINAMPAFPTAVACQAKSRPPGCPPCPPCLCLPMCTPGFFSYCSPCHQKCRCRDPADAPAPLPPALPAPMPMPMPVPAPPPVVMMPYPPSIRLPKKPNVKQDPCLSSSDTSGDSTTYDSSSYESWESSDLDSYYKRARKRKKRRKRIFSRRNTRRSSDSEVVKPVLTYVSENGDVKFKKKISNADATRLLDKKRGNKDKEQVETTHWLPNGESSALVQNRKQIIVKSDNSRGTLRQGKKQIVFRPPAHKKISNLTVSFQVAE